MRIFWVNLRQSLIFLHSGRKVPVKLFSQFNINYDQVPPKTLVSYPRFYGGSSKSQLKVKRSEVAQSHPTLCDPMDCSPPGSSSMGFSRKEYWSGLPFPSPGIEPRSPAWQADTLTSEPPGKPISEGWGKSFSVKGQVYVRLCRPVIAVTYPFCPNPFQM